MQSKSRILDRRTEFRAWRPLLHATCFLAKREQAWRSLGGAQDGIQNRATVFRAVPLN
jgi:hypothetical protein